MKEQKMFTEDQLRLALLEQSNVGILENLKKFDVRFDKLETKIDSHFHWMMGSISVLYMSLLGTLVTALAKSLKWF